MSTSEQIGASIAISHSECPALFQPEAVNTWPPWLRAPFVGQPGDASPRA